MKKLLISVFLVIALLTVSVGTVFAQGSTTLTGTVQSVTIGTDSSGATIVTVSLLDGQGATQTVIISLATATSLGLVVTDSNGVTTVSSTVVGASVTINTADVIPTPAQHPVGSALSNFFGGLLGVNYDTIMSFHENGVGFGVIAQALWLTQELGGDATTFSALLDAKQSGDFGGIILADGSTPKNWGDVVKSLKHGDNLGKVMSGNNNSNGQNGDHGQLGNPGNGHGKPGNPGGDHGQPSNPGNGHGKP
jgi:hypothetical protein